jgi:hypothetical protein
MKTVVFGLFEDQESAQRVLNQLAKSPLDLDAVAVVHADADVQRAMAEEAGIPERRGVLVGLVVGALAGGALGAWLGTDLLASLGPLLSSAAGVLIGGALGAVFSALNESLRLPPEHGAALTQAVDAGATVILVRSPSMPTARAIRDLFVAGGSVDLTGTVGHGASVGGLIPVGDAAGVATVGSETTDRASATEAGAHAAVATTSESEAEGEESHAMFAPPWRRTPASVRVPPGVTAVMESESRPQEHDAHDDPPPPEADDVTEGERSSAGDESSDEASSVDTAS